MEKHLQWLGWKVSDKVTGFEGVVSHVGIDLYGCVQAIVTPEIVREKNGQQNQGDGRWYDLARLKKRGSRPVMHPIEPRDDTEPPGGFDKPSK